jgi:T-complex protein 1 subunit delta
MTATVSAPNASAYSGPANGGTKAFNVKDKPMEVRLSNIVAAKALADVVRTSLGPKGMDKMIQLADGQVVITNDGATILKKMAVLHPCAKMLVELSEAQDVEAGDGTTSVVVMAGSLLAAAEKLLACGIHPSAIADGFRQAAREASRILREELALPVSLSDTAALLKSASTSLNSKVVSQYASQIAQIAVDAVLAVVDPAIPGCVDLRDIRVTAQVGGTVDDMRMMEGLVLKQRASRIAPEAPQRMEKARIGLVQFCLSPPKPDLESQIVVNDYSQMDRILREERAYLLGLCKRIKKTGCNVLIVQKSILRDAVTELSLHYLAKLKILVVTDVEREEMDFVSRSLGVRPIADIDGFGEERLAAAELVEQVDRDGAHFVHVTGIKGIRRTVSILARGANALVCEEAERSLHDALCVVRSLVKLPAMIGGGGAPEIALACRLARYAKSIGGVSAQVIEAYSDALEMLPTILAENAGLQPIVLLTDLRARHQLQSTGPCSHGINIRKGSVSCMLEENVVQPLLVSLSAIQLASETVAMIMKIDDLVTTR